MATDVKQNIQTTVDVEILSQASGTPKTGLVNTDINLLIFKRGSSFAISKFLQPAEFVEIDSFSMPGLYSITFFDTDLDVAGQLTCLIQENIPSDVARTLFFINVVEQEVEETVVEIPEYQSGINIFQSTAHTSSFFIEGEGGPQTGLIPADLEFQLVKNGAGAATVVDTTLTEINASTLPGYYSITLDTTDTNTLGDLFLSIKPVPGSLELTTQTYPFTGSDRGNKAFVLSRDEGVIVGLSGALGNDVIETFDKGTNWAQNFNPPGFEHYAVDGVVETSFYALASYDSGSPSLFFTDNKGSTFTAAAEPVATIFTIPTDVTTPTVDIGYLTTGGTVFKWDRNFVATDLNIVYSAGTVGSGSEVLRGVHATTDQIAVVVGDDGASGFAMRTTNGGLGWTGVTVPAGVYNAVDFEPTSGNVGWAVGDGGIILKSVDAGASFAAQTSGVLDNLLEIVAISETHAWAVGQDTILRTTNGGSTWTEPSEVTAFLGISTTQVRGIDFHDTTMFITGEQGAAPFVLLMDITTANITNVYLRYGVQPSLDLSTVLSELSLMQGAGFATGTDSLEALSNALATAQGSITTVDGKVDNVQTDVTSVLGDLSDMKGAGFNASTDSLEQIRDNVGGAADLTPILNQLTLMQGTGFDTNTDSLAALRTEVDAQFLSVVSSLTNIKGLSQENIRITGQTYDGNNNLTTSSIAIYPSKTDTENGTNPIATYTMTATYDTNGRLTDYQFVLEP